MQRISQQTPVPLLLYPDNDISSLLALYILPRKVHRGDSLRGITLDISQAQEEIAATLQQISHHILPKIQSTSAIPWQASATVGPL